MSLIERTKVRDALAGALSIDEVNQLGRDTGQAVRLRTITPHRLFLAVVSALASARVDTIADVLRAFNHQQDTAVAYKAFYNRLARPEVEIIATEPADASLLGGKEWAPHKIQGWTPDFLPDVLNPKVFDRLLPVTDEEGKQTARRLATEEGIFVGTSGGATVAAALKAAASAKPGSVLLAMLPDTSERDLGTYLFDDLNAGSDDEWLASLDKK